MFGRSLFAILFILACAVGCGGGGAIGSRHLDASAVPVALAWARADFVTFNCARASALEASDFSGPADCLENRRQARHDRVRDARVTAVLHRLCDSTQEVLPTDLPPADCVRVTVRDVSCGGTRKGRPVVTYDTDVTDVARAGRIGVASQLRCHAPLRFAHHNPSLSTVTA